ncbi:hypothetical protein Hamer_G010650, partial [Homarus americanus]
NPVEVNTAVDLLSQREGKKMTPVEISALNELDCEHLAIVLLDSVKKRLDPYIEMRDARAAAFLHPRFKLDWLSSQEQTDQVLIDIKEMLEESEAVQEGSTEEEYDKDDLAVGLPESKRPRLFSFMLLCSTRPQNQRASGESTKEVSPTLHPLFNLARELMGCTSTSAPSERIFNIERNYFTATRAQLGVASFRSLLMIKCN